MFKKNLFKREPTEAEIDEACLCFTDVYSLMNPEHQETIRLIARAWLIAWKKVAKVKNG